MKSFFNTLFKGLGERLLNGFLVFFAFFIALFICLSLLYVNYEFSQLFVEIQGKQEQKLYYNNEEITFRNKDGKKIDIKIEDGIVYVPIVDNGLFLDKKIDISENNIYLEDVELEETVDINCKTIDGSPFTNDDVALYDYTIFFNWTTWCSDCDNVLKEIDKIIPNLKENNIQLVGLLFEDSENLDVLRESVYLKMEENNLSFLNVIPNEDMRNHFNSDVDYLPTFYIIDNYSKVVENFNIENKTLQDLLKRVVEIKENSCSAC